MATTTLTLNAREELGRDLTFGHTDRTCPFFDFVHSVKKVETGGGKAS